MRAERAQMRATAWVASRAAIESQVSLADAVMRVADAGSRHGDRGSVGSGPSRSMLVSRRATARV